MECFMHRIPLLKQNTGKHDDYHRHHHRPRDKDYSSVLRIRSALVWHGMANQSKYQCSGCEKASKLTYYLSSVIFRVWRAKTQGDSWFRVFIEPMTTRCSFNTKKWVSEVYDDCTYSEKGCCWMKGISCVLK